MQNTHFKTSYKRRNSNINRRPQLTCLIQHCGQELDLAMITLGANMAVSQKTLRMCKAKLLETKAEILNRVRQTHSEYHSRDRGGDETDQAVDALAEEQFLTTQERLRFQLMEIEVALAKIERGIYGVCEETEEEIEEARLLAIPWTRLSIEGAEIREDLSKRYAK